MLSLDPVEGQNFSLIPFGTTPFLWNPTARPLSFANVSTKRNRTTVYQKGLREHLQLDIDDGNPLRWRRIVFETKEYRNDAARLIVSNDVKRLITPMSVAEFGNLASALFEGSEGNDWSTTFTAKVDLNRVKLHSDKSRILRSGNDHTHSHSFRVYYPFEKNFTYDEDEFADGKTSSVYATSGLKGMGDVYVLDIFQNVGGDVDDWRAIWRANATMYWHEK